MFWVSTPSGIHPKDKKNLSKSVLLETILYNHTDGDSVAGSQDIRYRSGCAGVGNFFGNRFWIWEKEVGGIKSMILS